MNKIKSYIPNFVTLLNMFSGIIALFFVFENNWHKVFLFVALGIFFDFFDGLLARKLNVSGKLGLQLDSLADMITSGLVPSLTLFFLIQNALNIRVFDHFQWDIPHLLPFFGLLVALASALRLAKFNIDERQTSSFIGMPTPANTLMILSIPFLMHTSLKEIFENPYFLAVFSVISGYLLNMELPLFSLKFKNFSWRYNWEKYILLITSLIFILKFGIASLFFIILLYIFLSITANRIKN